MFLWEKLQQLFEHFCVKLSAVPALNHGDEFLVFAKRREKKKEKVKRTDQEMAKWAISPFELLQEDVQIHAFLGINERDLESKSERLSHMSHKAQRSFIYMLASTRRTSLDTFLTGAATFLSLSTATGRQKSCSMLL